MSNGMTDGKPSAQLDLFADNTTDDTDSNMNISEKTKSETNSPMKDSGVEWIGVVPIEWSIWKFGHLLQSMDSGGTPESGHPQYYEGDIPFVAIGDMSSTDIVNDTVRHISAEAQSSKNLKLYPVGTTLYSIYATIGAVSQLGTEACINQALLALKPYANRLDDNFMRYALRAIQPYAVSIASSNTQKNLNAEKVNNFRIPVPPLSEQVAIASRLDEITGRIDEAVRLIDEQLVDLKDYRKALISEVVTRGVPSDSTPQPTKPTNTKWIPTIPTHWKTQRGKNCFILLNRPIRSDDDVITAFRDGTVTLRTNRRTEGFTFSDKEIGYQGIEPGDLVIHGMDAFAGTLGISDSRGKGSPILIVLDSPHNKDYLRYQLLTMAWYGVFTATATGIRVRSCDLRWNKLANMTFMLPPFAEQEAIVSYLDEMTGRISDMENNLSTQRDELLAYRQSVISEYVTGKKRVS